MAIKNKQAKIAEELIDEYNYIQDMCSICTLECSSLASYDRLPNDEDNPYSFDQNYNGYQFHSKVRIDRFDDDELFPKHTLEEQHFWLSLKNSDDKSYLCSAIVNPQRVATIKQEFRKLAQLILDLSWDAQFYVRILETPFKQFTLLNLFITNNKQPQLLDLGSACRYLIHSDATDYHFHDSNSNEEKLRGLDKVLYCWQTDNPLPVYEMQLVNIGSESDWEKVKPKILSVFNNELESEKENMSDGIGYSDSMYMHGIVYLDLAWLMTKINTDGGNVTNEMYVKMPVIRKIMKQLAQNM